MTARVDTEGSPREHAASTAAGELAAARFARLADAMAARGIDAVLLSRWTHGVLVSGARRVQVGGSGGGAPWVVVARGAPAPHVFTTDPDGRPAWVPGDHVHPLPWDPATLAARIATVVAGGSDASGDRSGSGRIAYDVLAVSMLERLRRALPGARFEDAAPLLAAARRPKSAAEIERLARAAAKAARAVAAARRALEPGVSSGDVAAAAYAAMGADAVGYPLAEVDVSRLAADGTLHSLSRRAEACGPTGARIVVDVVVGEDGFAGRCVRTFVCGAPTRGGQADLESRWREAVGRLARAARPGALAVDLREAARGLPPPPRGPLAHGLGIGIEPPWVLAVETAGWDADTDTKADTDTDADTDLGIDDVLALLPCVGDGRTGFHWASEIVRVGPEGSVAVERGSEE
jgi:Xaa-Pro dipeptidase